MTKGRVEAFSDGVIAISITVMVLDFHAPSSASFSALQPLLPEFTSYVLSFIFFGIYWNNHHHLFQAAKHVNGKAMWANIHLLFWLSIVPFGTSWMGNSHFASGPVAFYGVDLLATAVAYFILTRALIGANGSSSLLAQAVGSDVKGVVSPILYVLAIAMSWFEPLLSCALFVVVAVIWLVPDPRIARLLEASGASGEEAE